VLSFAWLHAWSQRRVCLSKFSFAGFTRISTGCAFAGAVLLSGCGDTPRPVVTPVSTTSPSPQPQSYAVVITTTGAGSNGLANVFDAAGDTLLTQANLGVNPLAMTLSSTAGSSTTANTDGTVNSFTPSTTLQTKNVQSSTLLQPAQPFNLLSTTANLFITEPNKPAVAVLTNNSSGVYQLTQELPVPSSPITVVGNSNASRVYSITQGDGTNTVAFGACENPASVATPGQVQAIEISTVTISKTLPVGVCPTYGVSSTDNNRTFILNRGSGTVTVINSQLNALDNTTGRQNLDPTTGTLTLPPPAGTSPTGFNAGPVFADYYAPASQLVTANYDSNTISIINVSLDLYGNDSSLFGQTITVKVGNGPTALTILRDGSRVYVANQKDSTISVVDLKSYQVTATIPVTGHPVSIASTFSTPYGQVYVVSSDQPFMTIIHTDTDTVNAAIQLDGNGVDVHTSAQTVAANSSVAGAVQNAINVSHASGSGSPCGFGAKCYATTP
jgi:YVTN family beta-propeller protein